MIYVLGRVIRNNKLAGFMCADINIGEVSKTKGALSPKFKMLSLADTLDAVSKTATQLKREGRPDSFASLYNKNNIDNLEIVNGLLSSEVSASFPTLDFATRDIVPNTPRGIILKEYTNYDTGKRLGFCLALYNKDKALFDVGRTNTPALLSYMQKAQEAGYEFVSNAQVTLDEDTGLLVISPANQGYTQLKIMNEATEGTIKQLSKIQVNKAIGDKKKLGTSTSTMMKNIAEAAIEITQEQDLFSNCTPSQVELIQRYYMEYTRQIFESLKKTSRLDIAPEKLAKLDMYRISASYTWEYKGIILGHKKGDYRCALGHSLSRAHIAECKDVKGDNGKNLRVLFGSTCVADFFQLDSGDIPVLSKAESVMVEEVGIIVDTINQNKVKEKWEKVSLLRHFVEVLDTKQSTTGENALDVVVGKQTAVMLRLFISEDIPFPKSITELVLMNMKYQNQGPVSYRVVFRSYLKRKALEKDEKSLVASRDQMILFKEYFGEEKYNLLLKYFPFVQTIFEFVILSKLQGEYGWDPENRSTGFRGMHNANIKRKYYALDYSCKAVFGFNEYTGEEFSNFAKLMDWYIETSQPVRDIEDKIVSEYEDRYSLQKLFNGVVTSTDINPAKDYALMVALVRGISRANYGSYNEGNSTYLNLDLTPEDGARSYGIHLEEPITGVIHNYYLSQMVKKQNADGQLLKRTLQQLYSNDQYYKEKLGLWVKKTQELTKKPAVIAADEVMYTTKEMLTWKFPEAVTDGKNLKLEVKNKTFPGMKLSTSCLCFDFSYDTTGYRLNVSEIEDIVHLSGASLPITISSDIIMHKPRLAAIAENLTLDRTPEMIIADAGRQLVNCKYNKDRSITVTLFDGTTFQYKKRSFLSNTKEESISYIKECLSKEPVEALRRRLENMAREPLTPAQKEFENYGVTGNLKDRVTLGFNSFDIGLSVNPDYLETISPLSAKYKLDLNINGQLRQVELTYNKRDSSVLEIDYQRLPRECTVRFRDSREYLLRLYLEDSQISVEPGYNSGETVVIPLEGITQKDKAAEQKATSQSKSVTTETGKAEKEKEKEIYTRDNPPKEYDKDNVIHALIYAYQQVGPKFSTKNTSDVKAALKTGKDYDIMKYNDKKAIQTELAYLVSAGGASIDRFNLPFKLNTFIRSVDNPELFESFKDMYTELAKHLDDYGEADKKAISILSSVIRYDKMTEKQKPHVERAKELYEELQNQAE